LTIRNSAARQAYGYQTQSMSFAASSALDKAQSSQDLTAGMFGAGSSILGGVSSAGGTYGKFLQTSGGSGGGGGGYIDNGTWN